MSVPGTGSTVDERSRIIRFAYASWLRLSPNNKISGGKVLSNKIPKGSNRLKIALRNAANAIMIVKKVPNIPQTEYQFLDQKRKKITAMKKLIAKFDISTNGDNT